MGTTAVLVAGVAVGLFGATGARSLKGTLATIESGPPARLMIRAEGQFQTFSVAERAVIERESKGAAGARPCRERIPLPDLTPGEYAELRIDAGGRVTQVRAVALQERAAVRAVNGASVVLEDGTSLTIGSVLRFVDATGRPSPTATVRPGEAVLLFRHPETRNIYRLSAEPRARTEAHAPGKPD